MSKDRTQWHRLLVLVMKPMFEILGYEANAEVDLSQKKQIVDLIVLKKKNKDINLSVLPKVFWEAFENLKDYNLITFKTYSESLNNGAIEEFYGHFTNFLKIEDLKRDDVNLYAITQHYPRELIKPFEKTDYLTTIKEGEIIDLKHGNLKQIRIIITKSTDNPVLALFSNNSERMQKGYEQIQQHTDLFDDISKYFQEISNYYGEEVMNMYTQEDYFRDYPDTPRFVFPWDEKYHEETIKKIQREVEAERKARKAEQKKIHKLSSKLIELGVDPDRL